MMEAWRNIDEFLTTQRIRVGTPTVAQTAGGAHKPNSFHYQGLARDYGQSNSDMRRILEVLRPYALGPDRIVEELFGLNTYVDAGQVINPTGALWASHQDHVHVALRAGRTLPLPQPLPFENEEDQAVPDNPDLPNIEGPLQLQILVDVGGNCTGYAIFSTATGELHGFGPGWKYWGRSEDLTPGRI